MKTQAEMSLQWRQKNPEKSKQSQRKWLEKNREKKAAYLKLYYQANRAKLIQRAAQRNTQRALSDPVFSLSKRLRTLLRLSLKKKGFTKRSRLFTIIGMQGPELLDYLWKNFENKYGIKRADVSMKDLHIDHIIPQASARTEEDLLKLYHFTNLQFLFAKDNLSKGARL